MSINSLRRLDGRLIKVVWALSSAAIRSESTTIANQRNVMFMVFNDYKQNIVVTTDTARNKVGTIGDDYNSVICGITSSSDILPILTAVGGTEGFYVCTHIRMGVNEELSEDVTAWSAERVILFGRTGSGKSTVAHMLTKGSLDVASEEFEHGSDAKGVTRKVKRGQGRGWLVTDTPGFGESKIGGTVPTEEAIQKLKTFVSKIGGIHSYYIYVVQYGRLDYFDSILWNFFTRVLPNAIHNLCVVITYRNKDLTDDEKVMFQKRSTVANLMSSTPGVTEMYSIVDTGPFSVLGENIKGGSLSDVRKWISSRHLRRLYGRDKKVVWAFDSDTANNKSSSSLSNQLDIIWTMFGEKRHRSVVVALENSTARKEIARDFHSTIAECTQVNQVQLVLAAVDKANAFTMHMDISSADTDVITAWSNEKIILFGRTGSGKSTVARMLTQGGLENYSKFVPGSSAKGVTKDVTREQGRGWFVTDTPGFGESRMSGTVPTEEAIQKLKTFMSKIGGIHTHFACVIRHGRIDQYDEILWKFFVKLLSNAEENLSIIVTCCENGLTESDKTDLRRRFKECKRFTWVNFKTLPDEYKTEKLIARAKKNAEESLERLEEVLADAGLSETQFHRSNLSQETLCYLQSRSSTKASAIVKAKPFEAIAGIVHILIKRPVVYIKAMIDGGDNIDESLMLLPQ
uniref:AIG1-type G domain-containing protein n=1 Tax=Physcomitrium patens TaxID=3218 RepID=A0A2K1L3H5_PHYPA|nr:hypothetical protein PHYPA_003359 [Physcomitrium patens]